MIYHVTVLQNQHKKIILKNTGSKICNRNSTWFFFDFWRQLRHLFLYCYNNYLMRIFQEAIEMVITAECLRANSNEIKKKVKSNWCEKVNLKVILVRNVILQIIGQICAMQSNTFNLYLWLNLMKLEDLINRTN